MTNDGVAQSPAMHQRQAAVVVIGGGLAGVCAAIAAARNGVSVVLIHERPMLGGNSSSEIRVGPSGATQVGYHRDARETGIIEELFLETRARSHGLRQANGHHYPMWDVVLEETVDAEPHLTLLLNTRVISVETGLDTLDGYETRVTGLSAVQQGTEATFHFTPQMVIDATGDGFIALQAGAPFRYGREPRAEFGESWAPEVADNLVLGSTIMFAARDAGRPVPYTPPAWAHSFPDEASLPYREHHDFDVGYWWIEWGAHLDTIADNDTIRRELQAAVFGVWDHIKNHCTVPGVREKAATWALDWIGHTPGKRESRRFEGDHIMTERDVSCGITDVPADVVAYGGWPIDLHAADGVYSPEQPCTQPPLPDRYGIPLRSLYSRTVSNLFLAGRNISQSHVAHGSTRVMKTCSVIGEAAGTAAAVAAISGHSPRALAGNPERLADVQQRLLRGGAYLPGVRNADPADLVLIPGVTISATSESTLEVDIDAPAGTAWEIFGLSSAETSILEADRKRYPEGRPIALDRATAQSVVCSAGHIDSVRLLLSNASDQSLPVSLQVRQAETLRDFGPEIGSGSVLASIAAVAPPGLTWVEFTPATPIVVTPGAPVILHLCPCPHLAWMASIQEPYGTQAGQWDAGLGYWRWIHGTLGFGLSPVSAPYGPANVASGVTRPEIGTNLWISDRKAELPQALTVAWPSPVDLDQVEITFDSQLSGWIWEGAFPLIARAYRVEVCDSGNEWHTVARVDSNIQRRRVHTFDRITARALRVTIEDTNGGGTARIVELRAYGQR
jgi:hypothetical protein